MSELSKAALYYRRELGWNVIPIEPHGKKPLIKWEEWQSKRVPDTLVIEWWKRWPDANIAEVLGKVSGAGVLDIDKWDGVLPYPDAWSDQTARGVHQRWLLPKGFLTGKVELSIGEWLCQGQYRILPPSIHPSGWVYKHLNGELTTVPDALLALIRGKTLPEREKPLETAPSGQDAPFTIHYKGTRDKALARVCGIQIRKGYEGEDLWNWVCGYNLRHCEPPLPIEDIRRIVKSIWKQEQENHPKGQRIEFTRMDEVTSEPVSWLWKPWLPKGEISLIQGDEGLGKSTITLDIAARLSVGRPMPGETDPVKRAGTLIVTSEDHQGTVRGRLEAAGASMEHILFFNEVQTANDIPRPLTLPDDVKLLEELITRYGLGLLLLDPWEAWLSDKVDSYKNQSVRRALYPLAQMAHATGVVAWLFRHLNKGIGGPAQYRGQGSVGVGASARSIMLVAPDPGRSKGHLVIVQQKNNLAECAQTATLTLSGEDGGFAHVDWTGVSPVTADQALAQQKGSGPRSEELKRCMSLLGDALKDGPKSSKEVLNTLKEAGVSESVIWRAREYMKVTSEKAGKSGWVMSLPEVDLPEIVE